MRHIFLFFTLLLLLLTGCATQYKSASLTNKPDPEVINKIVEINQALDNADKYLKLGSNNEKYYQKNLMKAEAIFYEIKTNPSYNSYKYNSEVVDIRIRLNEIKLKIDKSEKQLNALTQQKLDIVNENLDTLGKCIAQGSLETDKELIILKNNWNELVNSDGYDEYQSQIAEAKQRMLYFENKINGAVGRKLALENIKIKITIINNYINRCKTSIKNNNISKAKLEFNSVQDNWHKLELTDGFDISDPKILQLKESIQEVNDELNLK